MGTQHQLHLLLLLLFLLLVLVLLLLLYTLTHTAYCPGLPTGPRKWGGGGANFDEILARLYREFKKIK